MPRELVAFAARDFSRERPVADDVSDDSGPDWRVEKVSFAAAYDRERVPAFMYLPKHGQPPYQTVVLFPGSSTLAQRSSAQINLRTFDWVMKSGRALIFPIDKSTFERSTSRRA